MGWESDFLMCNYKQQNKTDDGGNHEEKDDDDSQQVQQDETKIVQARLDSWKRTQGEVPDFVNRKTGYYRYGTRKCSKCKAVKDKSAFSQNEADKPSKKRKCNDQQQILMKPILPLQRNRTKPRMTMLTPGNLPLY